MLAALTPEAAFPLSSSASQTLRWGGLRGSRVLFLTIPSHRLGSAGWFSAARGAPGAAPAGTTPSFPEPAPRRRRLGRWGCSGTSLLSSASPPAYTNMHMHTHARPAKASLPRGGLGGSHFCRGGRLSAGGHGSSQRAGLGRRGAIPTPPPPARAGRAGLHLSACGVAGAWRLGRAHRPPSWGLSSAEREAKCFT